MRYLTLLLMLPLLPACTSSPPAASVLVVPEAPVAAPAAGNQQLRFDLASGRYRCDAGATVEVLRYAAMSDRIQLGWAGRREDLKRNTSSSGLPRFESSGGWVWIDLPWKSVLLDSRTGKPLASDCVPG